MVFHLQSEWTIPYVHDETHMVYFLDVVAHLKKIATNFPLGEEALKSFGQDPHKQDTAKVGFGLYMVSFYPQHLKNISGNFRGKNIRVRMI